MNDIIKGAELYSCSVINAITDNPPTAKLKAKVVRGLIRDAWLLGALDSAEKILCSFQSSKDILEITDAQEMRELFLGELHIFVTDIQNYLAKAVGCPKLSVKIEELIHKYKPTSCTSSPSHSNECNTSDPLPNDPSLSPQ